MSRADVVVFAPHPDDEVIGCAGVIQQTLAAGQRVRVVFTTSGDGYQGAAALLLGKPAAAVTREDLARLGRTREAEAIAAARVLRLGEDDLVFLRYPDAGMPTLTRERRSAAARDFEQALRSSSPSRVYVTAHADEHGDHRVTNELVREAASSSGYKGEIFTFIVHSGGDVLWPEPGPRYESRTVGGIVYPTGVGWPPPIRVPLTMREADVKRRALAAHASQLAIDHDYLGKFVKTEEVFWRSS